MNIRTIFIALLLGAALMLGCQVASGESVVFIISEDEYDAARTLPEFAAELEEIYGFSCEILQGGDNSIPGMEALADADLAVIYVRRQVLPLEQMKYLRDYVASGKPVVGIRTASHAFCLHEERPPAGFEEWTEFDRDILGGNYHMHHGNKGEDGPFTYVWIKEERKSHPILTGIPAGEFRVPSWLYKTSPLADSATVLMMGRVADRKPFEPVAWTNTHTGGGRVFYTSLGHPTEFKMRVFRTLLTNGIFWTLKKPVPSAKSIVDKLLPKIADYDFGHSRKWLTLAEELVLQTQDATVQQDLARRLAKLLEPGTSFACKQWVCQQLSIIGSQEQVPVLAKMLTNEKLSDMARFALERIPSDRADEALREGLGKTSSKVRLGIINSIGQRRDGKAVRALGKLLSDPDRESAKAAALALGMIGSKEAAAELKGAFGGALGTYRRLLADTYLGCAGRLQAEGDSKAARKIYAQMYAPSEARSVRATALTGLVSIEKEKAIRHVTQALKSDDAALRSVALRFVRELPGENTTKVFCRQLSKLTEEARALLVSALGDRGDRSAQATVAKAADSNHESVRIAAWKALGKVGDAWAVPLLAQKAATNGGKEGKAARQSLSGLRGTDINRAIIELLDSEDVGVRLEAIKSLAARKAIEAVPKLLGAAEDKNEKIRAQSWKALGELAGEEDLPTMIALLVKIEGESERKAAEDAVVAVARQVPMEDRTCQPILAVMDSVQDVDRKASLLSALGRIGDSSALPVLRANLKDKDSEIKAAAIRALSSWPGAEPLEDLKQVMLSTKDPQRKVLAFRGYVRLIGIGDRPVAKTLQLYSEAMELAERVDEKRLVLAGLASVAHIEALKVVERYLAEGGLKDEAAAAAVRIAQAMEEEEEIEDKRRSGVLRVMRKVVETSENESTVEGAQEVIDRISN